MGEVLEEEQCGVRAMAGCDARVPRGLILQACFPYFTQRHKN